MKTNVKLLIILAILFTPLVNLSAMLGRGNRRRDQRMQRPRTARPLYSQPVVQKFQEPTDEMHTWDFGAGAYSAKEREDYQKEERAKGEAMNVSFKIVGNCSAYLPDLEACSELEACKDYIFGRLSLINSIISHELLCHEICEGQPGWPNLRPQPYAWRAPYVKH